MGFLNQLFWKIIPKILPAGSKIEDCCICRRCNEGVSALLLFMHGMDLKLGRNSYKYAQKEDENRITPKKKADTDS